LDELLPGPLEGRRPVQAQLVTEDGTVFRCAGFVDLDREPPVYAFGIEVTDSEFSTAGDLATSPKIVSLDAFRRRKLALQRYQRADLTGHGS
jgi:hypothetical protein